MPICKNCGNEIPFNDKDLCHYCGTQQPFDVDQYKTLDETQFIDSSNITNKNYKRKSKTLYRVLFATLGSFAIHMFYLGKWKSAIILLLCNISFTIGCGFLLKLGNFLSNDIIYLYWIISFGILFFIYFIISFVSILNGAVVDSKNQQLK